ncbi:ATP-dependent RNA helicase RhlB [Luteimonas yindakuii]|uniref:ATP-dependent RNA helicase RhlB n=1 Tax=Luteimonas yindakuii TaxID=2565782 RepID=UPI0010A3F38D|nr:ATP-dependent RNA helicase RhlB [Luteimonas yindakuii]QCO68559.1 ATP-dependent RNA helicase RhlB [Luteimonas yindakuii]
MSDKPLTDITFSEFDLHPQLLAGLEAAGFLRCTPIQALTLPLALNGRDVAGQAQTGTGKTLAFLVAVIDRLLKRPALADRKPEDPRALILAPTRELAIQIHKDAMKLDLGLKFALVYGGVDYDKQRQQLQDGADVIIATPGRLIDYVKQHKVVSLHACEMCVLDEADRMFDLGFIKDIRFLLRRMPIRTERQTLLFSATLSHRVLELAYEHMNEPEKIVVESEFITAAKVRQKVYYPSDEEKIPLLLGLLSRSEGARTMVFVNTKAFVERVARSLEKAGYRVGVLSGDVPQKKRESLLKKFQAGQLEILVATDVAARGLHIDGVSHVYNYDLPFDAEDYVHRIGRTARLGAEGDAISFACERYAMSLPDIEAFIEQKLPLEPVTAELLTALPRKPREGVELQAEEGESIGEIFREAREQRAADDARRGGPRKGGTGGAGAGRRSNGGRGSSGAAGSGERRGPRSSDDAHVAASPDAAPAAVTNGGAAAAVVTAEGAPANAGDAAAPARKRRRRRGPRKDGDAAGASAQAAAPATGEAGTAAARGPRPPRQGGTEGGATRAPRAPRESAASSATPRAPRDSAAAPAAARPAPASTQPSPSLLSRIGRGLKRLVGGSTDAR